MSVEWSNASRYNSFNSYKGLAYYEHYMKTIGWLEGKNSLPPPIEVNLDPIAECNLRCYFCITQRYLRHNRAEVGKMRKLPTEYMHNLVKFLAAWGVKGLCISGGGDPSLHESTPHIIKHADSLGMKVSMFTNGVEVSDKLAYEAMKCQWITLSVDASNAVEYERIKGKDRWNSVMLNIRHLTESRHYLKSKVMLTWCSLVLPENQYTLHEQCKNAKESGVQVFRVRPADFERSDLEGCYPEQAEGHRALSIDVPRVQEEFAKCHEEATKDFQVFTTTHKFDSNFHVQHDFQHCYPTLILPILTDGNGYICVDRKMESGFKLGSAFPNPEQIWNWWGSEAHKQMIKSIDISNCSRCTGSEYNAQIEKTVLEDNLCLSFP